MRVDTQRKLFAGVRIDGRMREQLDKCPPRDRIYFESEDSRFLTVLRGGTDTYLGKVLEPGTEARSVDDIRRNVWSILQRICPGRRDEGEIKIFTVLDDEPTFTAARPAAPTDSDRDDDYYSGPAAAGSPGSPQRALAGRCEEDRQTPLPERLAPL